MEYLIDASRSFSDSLGLSDALSQETDFDRSILDTQSMTDLLSYYHYIGERFFSDSLALSDSLSHIVTASRIVEDTQNISDSLRYRVFEVGRLSRGFRVHKGVRNFRTHRRDYRLPDPE